MFEIKYSFSIAPDEDYANADETDLRYYLFPGSAVLDNGHHSIIIEWDWVPLLDFSQCFFAICNHLAGQAVGKDFFEFPQSGDRIFFEKEGAQFTLTASFSPEVLKMSFADFQKGVNTFTKKIMDELVQKEPALKENKVFVGYLKSAESIIV